MTAPLSCAQFQARRMQKCHAFLKSSIAGQDLARIPRRYSGHGLAGATLLTASPDDRHTSCVLRNDILLELSPFDWSGRSAALCCAACSRSSSERTQAEVSESGNVPSRVRVQCVKSRKPPAGKRRPVKSTVSSDRWPCSSASSMPTRLARRRSNLRAQHQAGRSGAAACAAAVIIAWT
jgi:hypothetical protein